MGWEVSINRHPVFAMIAFMFSEDQPKGLPKALRLTRLEARQLHAEIISQPAALLHTEVPIDVEAFLRQKHSDFHNVVDGETAATVRVTWPHVGDVVVRRPAQGVTFHPQAVIPGHYTGRGK